MTSTADATATEAAPRAGGAGPREYHAAAFQRYANDTTYSPLLFHGDALAVLQALPAQSVDCVMTSPPYWRKREYANGGLGIEADHRDYVRDLCAICKALQRVLKPQGSFWLNIGDSYLNKGLVGIPWRVAFELIDRQGWILRRSVGIDISPEYIDIARERCTGLRNPIRTEDP